MSIVAVSGARGFVGQRACAALKAKGCDVRALVRTADGDEASRVVGDLAARPDLTAALTGVDAVIHLAARVHVMRETSADPMAAFRRVNVVATEHIARSAAAAGVRRFVFVSTVKVNGEATTSAPFRENDPPNPQDAYGLSKLEAEQALWRVAGETGLEVVIVRPPLVYGPRVGGNFARLLRWVSRGVPLPLASVHNRRHLVHVGNLADALVACVERPAAAGKTFLVSDDEAFSTPDLIRGLARAMGRSPRLWPCPPALLGLGARLLGKGAEIERLAGSLDVDSAAIRRELVWRPPFTAQKGLEETVAWFKRESEHA